MTATATAAPDQVYAVLVQILADSLLVPNLAVADVVPRGELQAGPGSPSWFDGVLSWQGRRVPVMRFEVANGAPASVQPGRRARILLMNTTSRELEAGVFGVIVEGNPHLVTLNRVALQPTPLRETDRDELVAARVRIANQEAAIPNFERIERELSQILATAA
jgi:chemosensory pili system protein ChpC